MRYLCPAVLTLSLLIGVPFSGQAQIPVRQVDVAAVVNNQSLADVADTATITLSGRAGVCAQVTGTWDMTLQFEITADGGDTWVAQNMYPSNSTTAATSTSGGTNGIWCGSTSAERFRVRVSADTSGTAVVDLYASMASNGGGGGGGGGGAVTNAGTFAVQEDGDALTALQTIDNIVLADDGDITPGTTPGVPVMGLYESTPTACTDVDGCIAGIDANRNMKTAESGQVATDIAVVRDTADEVSDEYIAVRITDGSADPGGWITPASDATHDSAALATGPNIQGECDDTATDAVDEGDAGRMRINCTTRAQYQQAIAGSSLGASTLSYISDGATEDEHEVCGAACNLYSIAATSIDATVVFLKCFNNVIGSTTPGTSTPDLRLAIPSSATGGGFTTSFPVGAEFSTGLTCWIVTGAADSDVTEVTANEVMVFYTYE